MAGILGAIGQGATIAITIKAIDKFSANFKKAETSLSGIAKFAGGAALSGIAAVGVAISALGVSSLKAAGDFEQTQIAFTTMLGSAEEAQKMLDELAEFARTTPFTLQGIEGSAKQLLAMGIETESLMPTLKSLGDVSAGLSVPLERLALNFGQVKAQGKLTGRELRDFAIAGVPLTAELAKQLGVSEAAISDMVSAGEIGFDKVEQAFISMSSSGGKFEDLMSKQAETVQGKFSNLQDSFELMQRELGQAFLPVISELADVFLNDVFPAIEPLIPLIGDHLTNVLKSLAPYLPQIAEFLMDNVEVAIEVFDALQPLIPIFMDLALAILPAFLEVLKALIPVIKIVASVLTPLLNLLVPVVEFIAELISGIARISGSVLGKIFDFGTRSAISIKRTFVGDAIINPAGEIIHTDPKDYLIATKSPESLAGGGITIVIEGDVNGTDPEEMAQAFARELKQTIRI